MKMLNVLKATLVFVSVAGMSTPVIADPVDDVVGGTVHVGKALVNGSAHVVGTTVNAAGHVVHTTGDAIARPGYRAHGVHKHHVRTAHGRAAHHHRY
ncbi:MAG: hypothetical protein NTW08_01680 [Gammaproteobacteria bacterium]|nr:hypothetical protein [Gammaproteobacteria bacterium]